MKRSLERQKKKAGYRIRLLLLSVELIFTAIFLWGWEPSQALAKTPEFFWNDCGTIAHALGGIGDKTYLNSRESFLASYQMGCRLFEVDLTKTSDGVWV